ncbi:hypothetical protein TNCV_4178581 [Trichonephila clavipes]|nr:hypothetical protein TNCV_4178581 [Trichonephila clavipes]
MSLRRAQRYLKNVIAKKKLFHSVVTMVVLEESAQAKQWGYYTRKMAQRVQNFASASKPLKAMLTTKV